MERRRTTRKKSRSQPAFTGQELIAYRQAWSINSLNGKWPSKPTWSENRTYTVVNGYRYLVRQFDDGGSYYIGGQINKAECALLLVHDDEFGRVGVLQGLRKGKDCPSPPGENPTGNLLVAAWRLCYKLGLHHMNISDIAKIHCNDTTMFILSDMELLTKGISWYEKFLPIYADQKPTEGKNIKIISWDECKRTARTNTWGYIKNKMIGSPVLTELQPLTKEFSDETPATTVFTYLKNLPDSCFFLAKYLPLFLSVSNVNSSSEYIWNTIPITTRDPPPSPYL